MPESGTALRTWLHKLKAPDAETREDGIKALEMLGDTDALPALAEIFAIDPEPGVRALAQWAGKSIYYGAIRQMLEFDEGSEDEQRQAGEVLAQAQARKLQHKRGR